jgi:hypothetical protein
VVYNFRVTCGKPENVSCLLQNVEEFLPFDKNFCTLDIIDSKFEVHNSVEVL